MILKLLYLVQFSELVIGLRSAPNIIFIMADDLGFNDVSWHNPDISTPNLHNLGRSGVILEQNYVQPICTPSRATLLTGLYPIHTGRQHRVLLNEEPRGLFTNLTLLPQYLKELGYSTHLVGKWHLGFCNEDYLPTRRGFDSFLGYYNGAEDYYKHNLPAQLNPHSIGYDFREGEKIDKKYSDKYSAHVFSERAEQIIRNHNTSVPLFLYLAAQSVHAPLQVPQEYEIPYAHIKNRARRTFSGMVSALDEAVGNITKALEQTGQIKNTIIVFSTDNGGQIKNGGNNFPLRGNKNTLWEGGTRGVAFITGPGVPGGRISNQLFHISDWVPTLLSAAGYDMGNLVGLDGLDQWKTIKNGEQSPRIEMLYNIDPYHDPGSGSGPVGAIRVGEYKLIKGNPGKPDGWVPPDSVSNTELVHLEDINNINISSGNQPLSWSSEDELGGEEYKDKELFLFNLDSDPTEKINLR
ncbi:arylsulfatase B isoform X3 [Eurytemora carolleeae]|uniref:arylsulfatase B isoform X2 n=1 Tax=Eurytemora carolleeae TaxID=1294199 RepID=UPI000C7883B1|nr:arylsulfatase B isoform X2 [Eurytemora carolleeae]XP_023323525.1 arylsulfatase B isoform X3 [Eurytemora carolleeae]|eukprot:XP_023323524.1 arylsulfatase B-like isoform X2 [Eurytemora affinis]